MFKNKALTPTQLIGDLSTSIKILRTIANDQSLEVDDRLEVLNERFDSMEAHIENFSKTNVSKFENLKEQAAKACSNYAEWYLAKENGTSYDSKSEANIEEEVVNTGKLLLELYKQDLYPEEV